MMMWYGTIPKGLTSFIRTLAGIMWKLMYSRYSPKTSTRSSQEVEESQYFLLHINAAWKSGLIVLLLILGVNMTCTHFLVDMYKNDHIRLNCWSRGQGKTWELLIYFKVFYYSTGLWLIWGGIWFIWRGYDWFGRDEKEETSKTSFKNDQPP